ASNGYDSADLESEAGAEDHIFADVDRLLVARLRHASWRGPYGLLNGLVGFGVYLLERAHSPIADEGLHLILDHLDRCHDNVLSGSAWHTDPELLPPSERRSSPVGHYNLGTAHGIAGIVQFLGQL